MASRRSRLKAVTNLPVRRKTGTQDNENEEKKDPDNVLLSTSCEKTSQEAQNPQVTDLNEGGEALSLPVVNTPKPEPGKHLLVSEHKTTVTRFDSGDVTQTKAFEHGAVKVIYNIEHMEPSESEPKITPRFGRRIKPMVSIPPPKRTVEDVKEAVEDKYQIDKSPKNPCREIASQVICETSLPVEINQQISLNVNQRSNFVKPIPRVADSLSRQQNIDVCIVSDSEDNNTSKAVIPNKENTSTVLCETNTPIEMIPNTQLKMIPRSRFVKPNPRVVDSLTRRQSLHASSASESEDDSRRQLMKPVALPRLRNISECSSTHPVLQTLSAPNTNLTAPGSRRKKPKCNLQARKVAEARREFIKRYYKCKPDRSSLKMFDLIFYNPPTNPMLSNFKPEAKPVKQIKEEKSERETTLEEEKVDAPDSEGGGETGEGGDGEDDNMDRMPVPQVKIGLNGEIILDEKSLVIETTEAKKGRQNLENSIPVFEDRNNSRASYYWRKARKRKDWTDSETKRFFQALNTVGTDFLLMQELFPERSRMELKNKFKREERTNKSLVDKALSNPSEFDTTKILEEMKTLEELNSKNAAHEQKEQEKSQKPHRTVGRRKLRSLFARDFETSDMEGDETPPPHVALCPFVVGNDARNNETGAEILCGLYDKTTSQPNKDFKGRKRKNTNSKCGSDAKEGEDVDLKKTNTRKRRKIVEEPMVYTPDVSLNSEGCYSEESENEAVQQMSISDRDFFQLLARRAKDSQESTVKIQVTLEHGGEKEVQVILDNAPSVGVDNLQRENLKVLADYRSVIVENPNKRYEQKIIDSSDPPADDTVECDVTETTQQIYYQEVYSTSEPIGMIEEDALPENYCTTKPLDILENQCNADHGYSMVPCTNQVTIQKQTASLKHKEENKHRRTGLQITEEESYVRKNAMPSKHQRMEHSYSLKQEENIENAQFEPGECRTNYLEEPTTGELYTLYSEVEGEYTQLDHRESAMESEEDGECDDGSSTHTISETLLEPGEYISKRIEEGEYKQEPGGCLLPLENTKKHSYQSYVKTIENIEHAYCTKANIQEKSIQTYMKQECYPGNTGHIAKTYRSSSSRVNKTQPVERGDTRTEKNKNAIEKGEVMVVYDKDRSMEYQCVLVEESEGEDTDADIVVVGALAGMEEETAGTRESTVTEEVPVETMVPVVTEEVPVETKLPVVTEEEPVETGPKLLVCKTEEAEKMYLSGLQAGSFVFMSSAAGQEQVADKNVTMFMISEKAQADGSTVLSSVPVKLPPELLCSISQELNCS